MPLKRIWTADELERMTAFTYGFEMLSGVLHPHNHYRDEYVELGFGLGLRLGVHVTEHQLGRLFTARTRFLVSRDPDVVLHPDAAFVRADRLGEQEEDRDGILPLVPDLVIDVVALIEPFEDAEERMVLYRRSGVSLVWMIRPSRRSVIVSRNGEDPRTLGADETLDGDTLLPSFRLPVAEVFR